MRKEPCTGEEHTDAELFPNAKQWFSVFHTGESGAPKYEKKWTGKFYQLSPEFRKRHYAHHSHWEGHAGSQGNPDRRTEHPQNLDFNQKKGLGAPLHCFRQSRWEMQHNTFRSLQVYKWGNDFQDIWLYFCLVLTLLVCYSLGIHQYLFKLKIFYSLLKHHKTEGGRERGEY